jgi:hypothetical protein
MAAFRGGSGVIGALFLEGFAGALTLSVGQIALRVERPLIRTSALFSYQRPIRTQVCRVVLPTRRASGRVIGRLAVARLSGGRGR